MKLYELPVGTLLICVREDTTDEGYTIRRDDISMIVGHDRKYGAATSFLSLTQGMFYTCYYGKESRYAGMSCYKVYEP